MAASAIYGLVMGIAFLVFTTLMPQAGPILIWSLLSIWLAWAAVTCWRRTGLPFASAAMVAGAVMSTCLAVLAAMGHPYPNLTPESWVLAGGGFILPPIFLLIESHVNPSKWRQWKHHMTKTSVWDIATGRQIPQLRNGGVS